MCTILKRKIKDVTLLEVAKTTTNVILVARSIFTGIMLLNFTMKKSIFSCIRLLLRGNTVSQDTTKDNNLVKEVDVYFKQLKDAWI
uniref:Uncharacterized protein n=1 Tax=Strongyloides papillosus TaxID=174720 RepID=A0A0N5CH46_STREA